MSVWANFADIYYAWQKYAKRNGIGAENPANWLVNSRRTSQTCLTGPLEYKYRAIFVLVLGVFFVLYKVQLDSKPNY